MYRTYQNQECTDKADIRYEEKITPREIEDCNKEKEKNSSKCETPPSSNNLSDPLFILLILLLLMKDNKDDNSLIYIIIALLLM